MFFTLLFIVLGIFLLMLPGLAGRRLGWFGDEGALILSRLMIYAIYPSLIFTSITANYTLTELVDAWLLPVTSAGIMLTGFVVGLAFALIVRFKSNEQRRGFLFLTTMNNYSFFPLALVVQFFGEEAAAPLIFSTLGAEVVMWTVGVITLSGAVVGRESIRHLFSPALVSLYLAVGCLVFFHVTGWNQSMLTSGDGLPYYLHNTLTMLGRCTVPVAMIIGGARIATLTAHDIRAGMVWLATLLRLIVVPLVAAGLLHFVPLDTYDKNIMVVVAVMPAAIASLMLSEIFGGDKQLISGSVLLTHLFAIITVPVLLYFLLQS